MIWLDLGFPVGAVVKNPPANAGNTGLIPGSEGSPPEEEMATHSSILGLGESPWTEEPGRLHSPWGLEKVGHD